ncbi:MAG: hypothetical protein SOX46_00975 [Clostridiaceae bacterium]|uniref:hypothetical protein n=1 Tax=Clostridium porci TaxID=2605778 RepID=UPI0012B1D6D1|nr:hypothetical protein [Clostridium porci]MDY3230147.1 hypothetical protein [Clostridiaceae bacterium]
MMNFESKNKEKGMLVSDGAVRHHLTCCKAACVHEEAAKADSECPMPLLKIE